LIHVADALWAAYRGLS